MIKLTRLDSARNMHRFALPLAAALFGEWVLIAAMGPHRLARPQVFPSLDLAQAALIKRQTTKMRRGYCLTSL